MCNTQDRSHPRVRQHLYMIANTFAAFCAGRREGLLRFNFVFYLSAGVASASSYGVNQQVLGPNTPLKGKSTYLRDLRTTEVEDRQQRKGC